MVDIKGLVGRNIRAARKAKGFSQWELAERSGLSADFIGKVERGRTSPSIESLAQIAEALGLPVRECFEGDPANEAAQGALMALLHLCRERPNEDVALLVGLAQLVFRRLDHRGGAAPQSS
jgi:transcriptional regulator with XRE-family HTH domain